MYREDSNIFGVFIERKYLSSGKLKTTKRVSRSPQIDTGSYATLPAPARHSHLLISPQFHITHHL